MALGSHLITVRRLKKYIDDVIGKKANLPDTSKTIIGNISQLNTDLSYNTTETKIGEIGNDDLYRKCYFADNVNITTSQVIDATLSDSYVKMVKSINVSFYDPADKRWFNSRDFYNLGTSYQVIGTITTTGLNLFVQNYNISKYCIVVEYTKA